jgi:sulfhydrogenase subunit beta (sulfur reductase)
MKELEIAKTGVVGLLNTLIKEYKVFAPVEQNGFITFQEIHSGSEAFLDYINSKKPPKEIFFPQSERLFSYDLSKKEGWGVEEPASEEKQRIIFGIRPCDARSLVILDNVFVGQIYKDPYYTDKRKNTTIIAVGCNQPGSTCFCTSLGGGPFSQDGSDLILIDIGQKYIIKVVTEKGEKLAKKHNEFKEADDHSLSLMRDTIETAEALIKPKIEVQKVTKKLDSMFDDPFWDLVSEKCLGCAVCTYLCPTCHCFDITDEVISQTGERVRTWDSCAFPSFTLEASGVNPRPSNKERYRQRIMHKFDYFVANHGMAACVGCGRCIKECPVNLDIRVVLNSVLNH